MVTILSSSGNASAARGDRTTFWETIGKPLSQGNLKEIGLDWEPTVVPFSYGHEGRSLQSSSFRIIKNSITGKEIAVCGADWRPFGNQEFYNLASRCLSEFGSSVARGGYIEGSKSSLRSGDRCVYLISGEVPELGFSLFDDDVEESHSCRLIFYNHHTPGCGMGIKAVVVRKTCANGMIGVGNVVGLKANHTAHGVSKYRDASSSLQVYKDALQARKSQLEALVEVEVDDEIALKHFRAIAGDKKKPLDEQPIAVQTMHAIYDGSAGQLLDDLGVNLRVNDYTNGTAYGVAQAVTAYYSHFKGGYTNADNAIKSRVFSDVAASTSKCLDSLSRAYLPKSLWSKQGKIQAAGVAAF